MKKNNPSSPKPKKRRSWISTVILFLILIAGGAIIAYPTVSDWWNSFHQSRAIAAYASVVEDTDDALMTEMLEKAEAYNAELLRKENRYVLSDEEKEEYNSLLDLTGTGVMGYIQINAIGISYPIYHGTGESVLQSAIGHIEGTSLPTGGESTHAAFSGHRALSTAKLFTDLDQLVEGDIFTVTVLNRVLTYEIDQIRIVEPSDMSNLNIVSGKDYCTLVTCHPYAVNTHRLLVRGHRIETPEDEVVITAGAIRIPNYLVIPAVGIPLFFLFLLILVIYYAVKKNRLSEEELREMVRKIREEAGDAPAAEAPEETPRKVKKPREKAPRKPKKNKVKYPPKHSEF